MAVFTVPLVAIGMMHAHRLRHTRFAVYGGHHWPGLEGDCLSLQMSRDTVDQGSRPDRTVSPVQ